MSTVATATTLCSNFMTKRFLTGGFIDSEGENKILNK